MTDITKFREQISSDQSIAEIEKAWPNNSTRFIRAFITYQRMQDAKAHNKIINCSQESLYDALHTCAQLRLMPSKTLDLVHFIPFSSSIKNAAGQWEKVQPTCSLIIDYKGMIEIAVRNPAIKKIDPRLVREGEEYKVMGGTNESIEHSIDPVSAAPVIAGYAIATLENGEKQFINMSMAEINKIRDKAKSKKFWDDHPDEMAKKTLVRRLWKLLPKCGDPTVEMAIEKVMEVDNGDYEGGRTLDSEPPATADEVVKLLEDDE